MISAQMNSIICPDKFYYISTRIIFILPRWAYGIKSCTGKEPSQIFFIIWLNEIKGQTHPQGMVYYKKNPDWNNESQIVSKNKIQNFRYEIYFFFKSDSMYLPIPLIKKSCQENFKTPVVLPIIPYPSLQRM